MSRSAEEQLLLEQRIEAMKRKNEELRRRHREVEEDKMSAAKQNALVSVNVTHDDDWIPGRHDDSPRQDRHQHNEPSSSLNLDPSQDSRHRTDHRTDHRNKNEGQRDEGFGRKCYNEEPMSKFRPALQNSMSSRKNDFQGNRQKSDGDRFHGSSENRRSGDWSGRANDGFSGRSKEWGSYNNRGPRGNHHSGGGDASHGSTFTSKVYKNSSMDPDRGKRPTYRLAEGDGPPPDPSYSFLGDSMRDSPESSDKRKAFPNRRGFPRPRGRGGQTYNNQGFYENRKGFIEDQGEMPSGNDDAKQQSYDAWRRQRSLIDQERINRQKMSDGNWSREWDNNKVYQEGNDRPHRWRRGNYNPNYNRGHAEKGYHDESHNSSRPYYKHRDDTVPNHSSQEVGTSSVDSPPRPKFTRRGRFTHHSRSKDDAKFSNGSVQNASEIVPKVTGEIEDAALFETNVESDEQLKVSVPVSGQLKRSVEGVGGCLRISVGNDGESSEGRSSEQKHHRKIRKAKRTRVLSSTSTGTTGTGEDDDGSWEDVSSDEENVSILTELQKVPFSDLSTLKSIDVSSGPESLDPIPAPGKEDEFLWDDFHPAGFQDNVTPEMEAEAAYKALLDEKAKQGVSDSQSGIEGFGVGSQQRPVSFKLDTSCLDESSDELEGAKLDPLLVTTQLVQAEVDCMSLTSLPADSSLPDETAFIAKLKGVKDDKIPEEVVDCRDTAILESAAPTSAEELSGPVSILDVSLAMQSPETEVEEPPMIKANDHPVEESSNIKTSDDVLKDVFQESISKSHEKRGIEDVKDSSCEERAQIRLDPKDKKEILSGNATKAHSPDFEIAELQEVARVSEADSKTTQYQDIQFRDSSSVPEALEHEGEVKTESLQESLVCETLIPDVKTQEEPVKEEKTSVILESGMEQVQEKSNKIDARPKAPQADSEVQEDSAEMNLNENKEVPGAVDCSVDVSHETQEEGAPLAST